MFQSSKNLMRAVLDVVDDMLVGAPEFPPESEAVAAPADVIVAPHPHHRSVQLRVQRRNGAVTSRTAHCLSPVRPPVQRQHRRMAELR